MVQKSIGWVVGSKGTIVMMVIVLASNSPRTHIHIYIFNSICSLQPVHSNNIVPINNFNDGYTDNQFMYVCMYVYMAIISRNHGNPLTPLMQGYQIL